MEEMIIQKKAYDYCKWLLNHTAKFPKSFRFSVAVRIENAILDFVESLHIANMRKDKIPPLKRADEALSRLRLLLRLSFEMQFINLQSYKYTSSVIKYIRQEKWGKSADAENMRKRTSHYS